MLKAGDMAVSESDGQTLVTLICDVTDQVEPGLAEHQRYWAVETGTGARRLAVVHDGNRVIAVRVRRMLDEGARRIVDDAETPERSRLRMLARRAIAANRIVAATNVGDLEDDGDTFAAVHDLANDLTIDTQRALARALGWLVGSDTMSVDIPDYGEDMFDELVHGIASDEQIMLAAGIRAECVH